MDDDIEGDDPVEYAPPVDRSRQVMLGILTLALGLAFAFGACWLADHLGGPVE